jgi:hypothetical protein
MPELLTRTWAASRRNGGRLQIGRVGGFTSVRWAASNRYGGRHRVGTFTWAVLTRGRDYEPRITANGL